MRGCLIIAAVALATAARADDGYAQGRAGWGAFVIPVPLAVQAERGLVPGQGALVLHVRPGGTADQLGVEPGDVVLALNGRPVASRHDVRDVVRSAAPGDDARVRVMDGDGTIRVHDGAFQERLPRPPGFPWGGMGWPGSARWPEGAGDPEDVVARQNEELLREQRELAELAEAVRAARAAVPAERPWVARATVRVDAEATP